MIATLGESVSAMTDYSIERSSSSNAAKIFVDGAQVAEMQGPKDSTFMLTANDGSCWLLSPRVNGEMTPFSMTVKKLVGATLDADAWSPLLTIKNHLFLYAGRFYMFNGIPEGRPLREFLVGKKYICRLDSFSFANLSEIDRESWVSLRRLRGVSVGDFERLGTNGYHVRLSTELQPAGLPLASSSYLLYSTA
jgi:hypothetical protein